MGCGGPEAGRGIWGEDPAVTGLTSRPHQLLTLRFFSGESLVKDTSCWAVDGNEGLSGLLSPFDRTCLLEGLDLAIFSFSFFPPPSFPSFYV